MLANTLYKAQELFLLLNCCVRVIVRMAKASKRSVSPAKQTEEIINNIKARIKDRQALVDERKALVEDRTLIHNVLTGEISKKKKAENSGRRKSPSPTSSPTITPSQSSISQTEEPSRAVPYWKQDENEMAKGVKREESGTRVEATKPERVSQRSAQETRPRAVLKPSLHAPRRARSDSRPRSPRKRVTRARSRSSRATRAATRARSRSQPARQEQRALKRVKSASPRKQEPRTSTRRRISSSSSDSSDRTSRGNGMNPRAPCTNKSKEGTIAPRMNVQAPMSNIQTKAATTIVEMNLVGEVHSILWNASRIFITPLGKHKGMTCILARAPKLKKNNQVTKFRVKDYVTFDTIKGEKGMEAVNLVRYQTEKREGVNAPRTQEPEKRGQMAEPVSNASDGSDTSSDGEEQKKRRKASPIREDETPPKPRAVSGGRKERTPKEELCIMRQRVENLAIGVLKRKETAVKKTVVKEEQGEKNAARR